MLRCLIDGCIQPVTGIIILTDDDPEMVPHCDDHAPEIMHELISDGHNRDGMVTATINNHVETPENSPRAWLAQFGPRTMADNIGKRVELMPHLDLWMQGDRYGTIVGTHGVTYTVQMDKSGTLQVLTESEVRFMPTLGLVK